MNDKVEALVEELFQEMFSFWCKTGRQQGFAEPHHQKLYDAINTFQSVEEHKKRLALIES